MFPEGGRPVRLPARRAPSAGRVPLRLGAPLADRERRDRGGRHHLRQLRAAARRPPRHRAGAARDRGDRAAVDRQLPGRQAGQPGAERARRPEGGGAGRADRRGAFAPAHAGLVDGARGRGPAAATASPSAPRWCRSCLPTAAGRTRTTSPRRSRTRSRNLPLSLIAGTIAVVVIYVPVNVVYLRALGLEGLAATTTPASDAAGRMFGALGDRFVTAAIAISTFGFLDLAILAPTRVYYAMAADGLFFPALATLHPRYRTPGLAIVLQSTWSCVLALSGTYGQLAELRRLCRLDFLRPDGRDRAGVPPHVSAVDSGRPMSFRAPGYPVRPDRVRARLRRPSC